MTTHFITVYTEAGLDQFVNVAHIVGVRYNPATKSPPVVTTTLGAIKVVATPAGERADDMDAVHQNIIDQITGRNP